MLHTRPTIYLPPIPSQIKDEEIKRYLTQVKTSIDSFVKNVYGDLAGGRVQHRVYDTIPTTDEVEEGEIVYYKSGSTVRLYANVDGEMKYVSMT